MTELAISQYPTAGPSLECALSPPSNPLCLAAAAAAAGGSSGGGGVWGGA